MTTPVQFNPKTRADSLALEIARDFNDEVRLPLYRQVCSNHDFQLVYRAYRATRATPFSQIRRSRKALFLYLIRKYEYENQHITSRH